MPIRPFCQPLSDRRGHPGEDSNEEIRLVLSLEEFSSKVDLTGQRGDLRFGFPSRAVPLERSRLEVGNGHGPRPRRGVSPQDAQADVVRARR